MANRKLPAARDIMNRRVQTLPADSDVGAAMETLLASGHSGAPVVDDRGAPVGVLSEHDCIQVFIHAIAEGWPAGRVKDHMTTEVDVVSPAEDLLTLATRFAKGRHRRLLVAEEGRLVGLICRRDLLQALEKALAATGKATTYDLLEQRHRELD